MKSDEILKLRETVLSYDKSIQDEEKQADVLRDEISDIHLKLDPIEKSIDFKHTKQSEYIDKINKSLCDFENIEIEEDPVSWVRLGIDWRYKNKGKKPDTSKIYCDTEFDHICGTDGKIMLFADSSNLSDLSDLSVFESCEKFSAATNKFKYNNYKHREWFDVSKLTEVKYRVSGGSYGQCYKTSTGIEIYFTSEYIGICLKMGESIQLEYNSADEQCQFSCGDRRAVLMPKINPPKSTR